MIVYQYPRCSTCVKALKFLKQKGFEFKSVDITDKAPTKKDLKLALKKYQSIKKLFNTSGVMYREMKIKDKINDMTEAEAFDLLSKNGKLVKRPFLVHDGEAFVGFKEDEYKKIKS